MQRSRYQDVYQGVLGHQCSRSDRRGAMLCAVLVSLAVALPATARAALAGPASAHILLRPADDGAPFIARTGSPNSVAAGRATVATGFHEVALQGFGDFQNSWPWAGADCQGRGYIGTSRNIICVSALGGTYPPTDPQVTCPAHVQDLPPTLGAQIWSVDPSSAAVLTQSNWTLNYASPVTMPITVVGSPTMGPRDQGFRGMSVYTEQDGTQALYVSGLGLAALSSSRAQVLPPSLLRSADGVTFQAVPADPSTTMGDINVLTTTVVAPDGMRDQASLHGSFYLVITDGKGNGTIFASPTPQLGDNTFEQITPPGMAVWSLQPFNGHLYFGVASNAGYAVWRTDCTAPPPGQLSCPPSAFTQVIPPGAGIPNNQSQSVTSMQIFTDTAGVPHLYVGAAANVAANPGPAELTRINPDDSWDVVVGMTRTVAGQEKDPLSGLGPGFGWPFNMHMWRMAVYQGVLYVGTYDASTSALKGTPQQQQYQRLLGFDLFASVDGQHFLPLTLNGFGDMYDEGVRALVSTPTGLFVGAANHWYGLRVFQGAVPPQALGLTPGNIQAVSLPGGPLALAWTVPPLARLFHVYRSEARWEQVRFPLDAATAFSLGAAAASPQLRRSITSITRTYWVPSDYHEIATTAAPVFVDYSVPRGAHVSYYIVAQDGQGHLSAPSPLVALPLLGPRATFGQLESLLATMESRGAITPRQAVAVRRGLYDALQDLRHGAIPASRATLDALRRLIVSAVRTAARTATAQRYAAELGSTLTDVSTLETLVSAHLLTPAELHR